MALVLVFLNPKQIDLKSSHVYDALQRRYSIAVPQLPLVLSGR